MLPSEVNAKASFPRIIGNQDLSTAKRNIDAHRYENSKISSLGEPEIVFVDILRSPGIDSQPGGRVR
jgi:hypothetical protein